MTELIKTIDVDDSLELRHVAEEVQRSHAARVLRRDGENLATIVPMPAKTGRRRRPKTKADYEAFRAAAGGWKDLDTDKLVDNIYESRGTSTLLTTGVVSHIRSFLGPDSNLR
jgi:hypothetical protein